MTSNGESMLSEKGLRDGEDETKFGEAYLQSQVTYEK